MIEITGGNMHFFRDPATLNIILIISALIIWLYKETLKQYWERQKELSLYNEEVQRAYGELELLILQYMKQPNIESQFQLNKGIIENYSYLPSDIIIEIQKAMIDLSGNSCDSILELIKFEREKNKYHQQQRLGIKKDPGFTGYLKRISYELSSYLYSLIVIIFLVCVLAISGLIISVIVCWDLSDYQRMYMISFIMYAICLLMSYFWIIDEIVYIKRIKRTTYRILNIIAFFGFAAFFGLCAGLGRWFLPLLGIFIWVLYYVIILPNLKFSSTDSDADGRNRDSTANRRSIKL